MNIYVCTIKVKEERKKKTLAIRLHTECAVYRRRRHRRMHLWPCTQYSHKSHTVAVASSRWMCIEHDLRVAAFCFSLLVPLFSLLFIFSLCLFLYLSTFPAGSLVLPLSRSLSLIIFFPSFRLNLLIVFLSFRVVNFLFVLCVIGWSSTSDWLQPCSWL